MGIAEGLAGVGVVLYLKEMAGDVLYLKEMAGIAMTLTEMIQSPVALHSHIPLPELHSIRNPSHAARHLPRLHAAPIPSPPSRLSHRKSTDCDSCL